MWFAVEASSQKLNVAFSTSSSSSVVQHFVASARARSVDVSALVRAVPDHVAHRCSSVIAHRCREARSEGHYSRRGPLAEFVSVPAHSTVSKLTSAVWFRHSRIGCSALSSVPMQRNRHSFRLPPNHRLVATGFIVFPSSYVSAPALQPGRSAVRN